MRIDIVTILPELLEGPFSHSIIKRGVENGFAEIYLHNPRDYSKDKHKRVDDYQFGGGAGMVMMVEPLALLLDDLLSQRKYDEIIYVTPDGETLNQKICNTMSTYENLVVICGHYKGIDERIRKHYVTKEISIGDYVLTGGELAAAVLCDSLIRLIPGVMSDSSSALTDSFQDELLAPPVYSRPAIFRDWEVPEVLTSGNFKEIEDWRFQQALERTKGRRPDLIKKEENNK